MPRKNNRKVYTTGKSAVFFGTGDRNAGNKLECAGCAFARHGNICSTSDGACLITARERPVRSEGDNIGAQ